MKEKFDNSAFSSNNFGNNLRENVIKFQLDHEVVKNITVEVDETDLATWRAYAGDGHIISESTFSLQGHAGQLQQVLLTEKDGKPVLDFIYQYDELTCDLTNLYNIIEAKQDKLIAGNKIRLVDNVISVALSKVSELENDRGYIYNADGISTALGYTPANETEISAVGYSGNYTDLINKPTIGDAEIAIKVNNTPVDSFTVNTVGNKIINIPVPNKTSELINDTGFLSSVGWDIITNKPIFAAVAESGNYSDLIDRPEFNVGPSGSTFTERLSDIKVGTNYYTLPSTLDDIPDGTIRKLADKADKIGPLPEIIISNPNTTLYDFARNNNEYINKPICLNANLGNNYLKVIGQIEYTAGPHLSPYIFKFYNDEACYEARIYGLDGDENYTFNYLSNSGISYELVNNRVISIDENSTNAQYPSAKCVYDKLQGKQDKLVAGTNIKTINYTSILGSGNINIDGGTWGNIAGNIADQQDLQGALNLKQNKIANLDTIVAGAAKGATAVQPEDLTSLLSDKVVKIAAGNFTSGSISLTGLAELRQKYSHLIITGHQQYAEKYPVTVVIDLDTIYSGNTIERLVVGFNWDRPIPAEFFRSGDSESTYYVNWNGSYDPYDPSITQTWTATLILGIPKD